MTKRGKRGIIIKSMKTKQNAPFSPPQIDDSGRYRSDIFRALSGMIVRSVRTIFFVKFGGVRY